MAAQGKAAESHGFCDDANDRLDRLLAQLAGRAADRRWLVRPAKGASGAGPADRPAFPAAPPWSVRLPYQSSQYRQSRLFAFTPARRLAGKTAVHQNVRRAHMLANRIQAGRE